MARRKNQAHRRAELVAAASALLVERGVGGARLVDIADAVGVTSATVSYYYPDIADLYADTYETASVEYVTLRQDAVRQVSDPVERLRECVRLGIPQPGKSSQTATALLLQLDALGVLSPGNTSLASNAARFYQAELDLYVEVLEAGTSVFSPALAVRDVAQLLLASEDGIAIPVLQSRLPGPDGLRLALAHAALLTNTPSVATDL